MKRLPCVTVVLLSLCFFTGVCAAEVTVNAAEVTAKAPVAEQDVERETTAISQDRAMQIAREMFPEMLEGKELRIQLNDDYQGNTRTWQLDWIDLSGSGRRAGNSSIALDADTGALVSMYRNSLSAGMGSGAAPVTEEVARQKAEEYAKKYCPADFTRTRPSEENSYNFNPRGAMQSSYSFSWERVENGIPVEGDGIYMGIDIFSGQLVHFRVNWHRDVVFPRPGALPEGLEARALNELGLILCYQVTEAGNEASSGVPGASLIYQLNSPGLRLDPVSGEALTMDGKKISLAQCKRFASLPVPSAGADAVEPGVAGLSDAKISQADTQKTAREFFKKLGLAGEVTHSGGGAGNDGVFFDESLHFSLIEGENIPKTGVERRVRSVGIDTQTGEITSYFNNYTGSGQSAAGTEKAISRDAARAKAVDLIKLIHPERLELLLEAQQSDLYSFNKLMGQHNFSFVRLVNGVPFLHDGIRITVDAAGEVTSYDCDWHAVRFSSTEGIITRTEAEKAFLENMRLKLAYFFPWDEAGPELGSLLPGNHPALCLVFDGKLGEGIDARTGQPVILGGGRPLPVGEDKASIPQGHWAYAPLSVLAASGLLPADSIDPDGPVCRRDAIRVLMSANDSGYQSYRQDYEEITFNDVAPDDRDYAAIQAAVHRGVLEGGAHFLPEQPVTREVLAVWLVRALGYGEIAEMPAKIELKAIDAGLVSEKARNYVAIACGLGLMRGDENGLFRPADNASWAELASLVTRAAPRLRAANY
ncbi:MAG: S-layer homology domain-containing protein [Desulfotomaculaceae bacterium]|nr:S-layer homology domain-containing protein [Desulfotomaculaceae bacterium]